MYCSCKTSPSGFGKATTPLPKAEQTEGPLHKRAVLGNLTCSKPGCAANVTLQLYDPETEREGTSQSFQSAFKTSQSTVAFRIIAWQCIRLYTASNCGICWLLLR